ncbi:MAG: sugar transferase [Bacteroidales bacterium]|nr:sugar transferase [Bacteroidales bacterium]
MNPKKQVLKYLLSDYLASVATWVLFFMYRKIYIESVKFGYPVPFQIDKNFILGLIFIPFSWLLLHYLSGYYRNIYRKSRLQELAQTFVATLIGVVFLFFLIILNDVISTYKNYYHSVAVLFSLQFIFTYLPRLFITSVTNYRIHTGKLGFNTVIIGNNQKALNIYKRLKEANGKAGYRFVGFVSLKQVEKGSLEKHLPYLGPLKKARRILSDGKEVQEIILAIEEPEKKEIGYILNQLFNAPAHLQAIPELYDILAGRVRMSSFLGTPLIEITHELMPAWQVVLKTLIDYTVSLILLVLSIPVFLVIAPVIKLTSSGPVLFKQERVGRHGKPFMIYKFRTMYKDAETEGPALSSRNDPRITPVGRFLRRTRMDEIPNFINVLKGDMSLVGPRPERKHFVDQIVCKVPHYIHLQKVKPGITSWGQVKFGYAENVDQMIERMQYDLIYIQNMSLYVDMKILSHTLITVLKGKGK